MVVVLLTLELRFPGATTLKEKRSRLRPFLEDLRRRWNVSAAEVEHRDLWQRSTVAVAAVNTDRDEAHRSMEAVAGHAGRGAGAELLDYSIEFV